jgi:NTE family protein
MRIGVDGQPLGEEPPGREQPLLSAFGVPDAPDIALAVGARARRVLDRTARPFGADGAARAVVAPALLDDALVNPLGAGARFVERAVSTLISAALAGNVGDWTEQDSRQAFATAFGLDAPNTRGREEILGQPFTAYDFPDEGLLSDRLRRALLPVDEGGGLPPGRGNEFVPLDDVFERTCLIGVFESMHNLAVTYSRQPREATNAKIDKLDPDHGCGGEKIRITGSGFGEDPSTYGLVLMFPAFEGGWISVDVADKDWSDSEIRTTVPKGVGIGPVGFIQISEGANETLGAAVSEFVGAVGECLGPGAELHAASTFGKLGTVSSAAITETRTNVFRGGKPKIDYFLANGALSAIVRPTGTIHLQWSAINADSVSVSAAAGAPAEQPAVPPADASGQRGDVLLELPGGTAEWSGTYEIVATNQCGQATASVRVEVRSTLALAFSGGGSKGAFEVGVARCLYDVFGVRPDLLVGASVGALNAAKLAEGPAALPQLEQLWRNMMGPADLFLIRGEINTILNQLGPGMRTILRTKPLEDLLGWSPEPPSMAVQNLNIAGGMLKFGMNAIGTGVFGSISDLLYMGLSVGLTIGKIVQAIEQLLLRPSLLLFDPIESLIQSDISPTKVAASGIQLRIVVNGARTGRVRYVDGNGAWVDGGPAPGLRRALTASAAIPIAFPPITLPDSESYVDGGVLENIPIEAAVRAGADEVIAILPSPAALPQPSAAPTTLLPVATRGMELLVDGSTRRQLEPFRGWGVPVKVIAPRIELHNLLAVDPGLIKINMDYGYMCAYDEMQSDNSLRSQFRTSSDAITRIRWQIWWEEHFQNNWFPKGVWYETLSRPWGTAEEMGYIRDDKRRVRALVVDRVALAQGSKACVPADIATAWTEWEGHFFSTLFPSPWGAWSSFPRGVLQAETPPPPLP